MRKKGTDIYIRVFERFARYRAWEWLTKMGLAHILMAYAEGDPDIWPLFNWRGKSVDAIFRCHLTKSDKAVLRNERIEESMLRAWMQWKKYQPKAALNDILQIWPEYWGKQRIKTESMQEVMKQITPEEWLRYEKAVAQRPWNCPQKDERQDKAETRCRYGIKIYLPAVRHGAEI